MKIKNIELKSILLWMGTLFIMSGTMFFFAYNWDEIHKFTKLGLTLILILGAITIHLSSIQESLIAHTTLWMAIIGIGIELAIFGQVYQTGADAYNLFVAWSIFAFGFIILSSSSINWFTYLILLNLSLSLYISQSLHIDFNGTIAIKIIFNIFTTAILYFLVERKKLIHFNWLYKLNLIYVLSLLSILLLSEFIGSFSFYSLFAIIYLLLLYHIKEKDDTLLESITILSLVFLIPALASNIAPSGTGEIYFGVLIFIISSVAALKYLIDKIKTSNLSLNYEKLPWMIHLFIFTISIFSAIGIILVGGLLHIITKDSVLFLGVILLVIILALRKEQKTSLSWYYGLFVSIILSEIAIYSGLIIPEYYKGIFIIHIPLALFTIALLQILLFVLIKDYIQRILNIVVLSICIIYADGGSLSYLNMISLLFILTLLVVLSHYSKKEFFIFTKNINDGVIVSILIVSFFLMLNTSVNSNILWTSTIAIQILSSILLLYVAYEGLKANNLLSKKTMIVIFLTVFATSYIPSLNSVLTLMVLSFYIRKKHLTLLSLIVIIISISLWYYNIELSLLYKSVYMICAGLAMVTSYYFINKKGSLCEL